MILQFRYAIRDFRKKPVTAVLFMIQLYIAGFVLLSLSHELLFSLNGIKTMKNLEKYNLIYFHVPLNDRGLTYSGEIDEMLTELLDRKHAAYSIVDSIELDNESKQKVVVGMGAAFAEVFGLAPYIKNLEISDPIALLGADVKHINVGESIPFGTVKQVNVKVAGRLPPHANFMNRTAVESLDQSVLILTGKKQMIELYGYYHLKEWIRNVVLLNPSQSTLIDYVSAFGRSNFGLTPIQFNTAAFKHYNNIYTFTVRAFLFYFIAILFVLINLVVNLLQLIRRNMREYAIHLLYGARYTQIYIRTILYIFMMITLPLFFAFYQIWSMGMVERIPLFWVITTILGVALLIAALPMMQIKANQIPAVIGRRE